MDDQTIDYGALADQARKGTPPPAAGLITPGNIDLHSRPVVRNADGSISTVRSASFNQDGKEVLVPTVSDDGRILSNEEAWAQYKKTGKHLGIFDSPQNATTYAQQLHQDQAAEYGPKSAGSGAGIDYAALASQARGEEQEPIGYRNGMPVYSIDVYGRAGPPPQPPVFQGTDEQGKPVIASPPGPPPSPIPYGITSRLQSMDPRTGEFIQPPKLGDVPFLDWPTSGYREAAGGVEKIRTAPTSRGFEPWLRQAAGGGSDIVRGTLKAVTPLLPGALVEAPLSTLLTMGAGTGLSNASEATLNAIGVPKEYSALASDLIGIFGAGAAYAKLRGLAKLPYVAESNAIQAKLEEAIQQAKDPNATPMEQAAAKARVDALMQGLQQTEAGRAPISPQSAAAQAVISQGAKYGVRLSAGDVSQRPTLKNIEVSAEKVPGMGMESFREKQQVEAKAAATGVKSQYEDALINAEPSSLAELQKAAEEGDQRARNVLEKMNQAGNDPDRIIQASIGLGDWTTRQQAKWLYDRVQKLAEDHELGDVPLNSTGKAIGSSLQELRPAKLPNKEVIGLLQKIKESISPKLDAEGKPMLDEQGVPVSPNNTYSLIRQLHSDLGERIREYYQGNNALIGEKGVGHLERVQNALEDDMRNYAKNSGVPEIVDAGQTADEYYKSARVPYKNGMLAAASTSNEPDQVFQQFIKAGKGDRAKNFYDALDDRGKAAVRYNMIAKAVDDSVNPQSGIFSPQKFFTAVDKLDEAYGVFFTAKDKAEIQGFKNLMGHVTRAGQYAENPPTGQRVIPYLIAGGAAGAVPSAIAHPFLAGGGLALIGAARGLLTTVKGRDLLLRLNGVKQGTPLMESVWQRIGKEMLRFKPPEEPPPGTPPEGQPPSGGGPPSTPPGGGGKPPKDPWRDMVPGAENDSGIKSPNQIDDPKPGESWYHGRRGDIAFSGDRPAFFTRSREGAKWYSQERGDQKANPTIGEYGLDIKQPAHLRDLLEVVRDTGATEADIAKHSPYAGDNLSDYLYVPKVRETLKAKGFDGYIGFDSLENGDIDIAVPLDSKQVRPSTPPEGGAKRRRVLRFSRIPVPIHPSPTSAALRK